MDIKTECKTIIKKIREDIMAIEKEIVVATLEYNELRGKYHQIQYSIKMFEYQMKSDIQETNKLNKNMAAIKLKIQKKELLLKNFDVGKKPEQHPSPETLHREYKAIIEEKKSVREMIDHIKIKQHIVKMDVQEIRKQHEQFMEQCKHDDNATEKHFADVKMKYLERLMIMKTTTH